MRPIEILMLVLLAAWLFVPPRLRGARQLVAFTALLTIPWHLAMEGYRWQMVPAYVLIGIAAFSAWWQFIGTNEAKARRSASPIAVVVGLAVIALPIVLPVPRLPEPEGRFAVGSVVLHLVDQDRAETFGALPGDPRELVVQLFYPARPPADGAEPAPWIAEGDVVTTNLAKAHDLYEFTLNHLEYSESNSYPDVEAAADGTRYPVIIYSHGWKSFRNAATNQAEELASQGFVVATIDHTFGSAATVFPDGRVERWDPAALPSERAVGTSVFLREGRELIGVFEEDLRFVLDTLVEVDAGSFDTPLRNRLDTSNIGLFGHSTGGGAVVALCASDARCKAGLGFDPWVEPLPNSVLTGGLDVPFAFIRSEEWSGNENDESLRRLYDAGTADHYWHEIRGSEHRDFAFPPMLSPISGLIGISGNTRAVVEIAEEELVAFFGRYLQGRESPFLTNPSSAYDEILSESR